MTELQSIYQEYRCPNDNKLLFKGLLVEGEVEVKCKYCKELVTIHQGQVEGIICLKPDCVKRVNKV
ncbi:MAG: hypothetical protein AAB558_03695 [Patescibacteria group bacterium]